eukprot:scaffold2910_cov390-Prasinococcus_capsulatus_cf.AAC.65
MMHNKSRARTREVGRSSKSWARLLFAARRRNSEAPLCTGPSGPRVCVLCHLGTMGRLTSSEG